MVPSFIANEAKIRMQPRNHRYIPNIADFVGTRLADETGDDLWIVQCCMWRDSARESFTHELPLSVALLTREF